MMCAPPTSVPSPLTVSPTICKYYFDGYFLVEYFRILSRPYSYFQPTV